MNKKIEVIHDLEMGNNHYSVDDGITLFKDEDDMIWVNTKTIAKLFGVTSPSITTHFGNISSIGEFDGEEVRKSSKQLFGEYNELIKDSLINSKKRGRPDFWYNFDVVLSMGYRINSDRAIEFRKACNQILKDYALKGYVIDEERISNDNRAMEMLLKKVQKIRNEVKDISGRLNDMFTLAKDYDPKKDYVRMTFAKVNNLFLYAITGSTSSEIIVNRCSADEPECGTLTRSGNRLSKSDVINSRNYLIEEELLDYYSIIDATLAQLEFLIRRKKEITVDYICNFIVGQLKLLDCDILEGSGTVRRSDANRKAIMEYNRFKNKDQTTLDALCKGGI